MNIPLEMVLELAQSLLDVCTLVVCHNKKYDLTVLAGEFERMNRYCLADGSWRLHPPTFCTMEATTPLCKLPGRFAGAYKWPKLEEAYWYAFNKKLQKAHDAMWDVRATAELFWWLKSGSTVPVVPEAGVPEALTL